MRCLLISANTEKINILPMPIGLLYIAAATIDKGHDVKVLDLMTYEDPSQPLKETIAQFHPDVIGISVRNIDDQNMAEPKFLLEEVRDTLLYCRSLSDVPIILGGAGYSIFPDAVLAYLEADMGIQGEGEYAFLELLERLEKGVGLTGLPGLYVKGIGLQAKRKFIRDFNTLNISIIRTLSSAYDRNLWVPFQTRRGCPMNCSYCSTATIEGRLIRKRPPHIAIEELKAYVEQGFNRFFFVDNTFNLPPSYAKDICRMIIKQRLAITWQAILYPRSVDEELVRLMAEAGCREVSLGFESGCERILKNMNKRFGPEEIRKTALMLKGHGIRQMGFLMLGGPGETRESVLESLDFADSLPLDSLKITQGIRIYPYTTLAKIAVAEGLVSPDDNLLRPTFYMVREIADWLKETLKEWMAKRNHWMA